MPNELGSLIAAEVARAEGDFQGGRARALSIVGVTGGISGLVSGLLAIAAGSQKDILPGGGFVILILALSGFVGAAVLALCANLSATVVAPDMTAIKTFVTDNWDDDGWDQQVADISVDYVVSLRAANSKIASLVNYAIMCEIGGIAFISVLAFVIVWHLQH